MNYVQLERLNKCLIDWNVNYSVYPYGGYTINELLCQFFEAINKSIDVVNEYTKMVGALKEWIETEGLKKEVNDALDRMIEDGTLDNIINHKLFEELKSDIDKNTLNVTQLSMELGEHKNQNKNDFETVKQDIKNNKDILDNHITSSNESFKEVKNNIMTLEQQTTEKINKIVHICSGMNVGRCVNNAIEQGYRTIKIVGGSYNLDEPIILKSDVEVYGDKNTIITNSINAPAIKTLGNYNEYVNNCYIHDLHIIKATPSQHWHLDLCNLNMSKVERVRCEMADVYSKEVVGGLYVYYNGTYEGEGGAYSLSMDKLDFRSCSVKIGITDCYLTNSNIWGKNRQYALWIASSSQQILNCQFVGGSDYGAIFIRNESDYDVEILKINNCYFDGSYENINTYAGIYGEKLRSCVITNNTFWRQKDSGIILVDAKANVISNNVFEDNGIKNLKQGGTNVSGGIYDIKFTGKMDSNIISNNTYASYDNFYIKPKAIDVSGVSTWNDNVFTNNIIFNNGHYDVTPFNGFTSLGTNTLNTNGCYGSWLPNHDGTAS